MRRIVLAAIVPVGLWALTSECTACARWMQAARAIADMGKRGHSDRPADRENLH